MKSQQFIPGLQLAEAFFREIVKPIIDSHWPDLQYAAALIGSGSEVLGFDDEMSSDHHWGPRLLLFLTEMDFSGKRDEIHETFSQTLPAWFKGYPTNFTEPNLEDNGVQLLQAKESGPINHRIELFTLQGFFADYLNINIEEELELADWLTLPQQKLRTITAGGVFHDDLGLQTIRERFVWYPHDVWLYLLASGWTRLGQEEHLMGRAGIVGDEIGSALIASRLVRDIIRLAFLMEREFCTYPKWFGTAFDQLQCASRLKPQLEAILHAKSWQARETPLCAVYEQIAEMHNALKLTKPLPAKVSSFFGRPFQIIHGDCFAQAFQACIRDTTLAGIRLIGNIDLISDNTDFVTEARLRPLVRGLYK